MKLHMMISSRYFVSNVELIYITADETLQGWVDSLRELLAAYMSTSISDSGRPLPTFDYSLIRPAGTPIRGFGGTCQGAKQIG